MVSQLFNTFSKYLNSLCLSLILQPNSTYLWKHLSSSLNIRSSILLKDNLWDKDKFQQPLLLLQMASCNISQQLMTCLNIPNNLHNKYCHSKIACTTSTRASNNNTHNTERKWILNHIIIIMTCAMSAIKLNQPCQNIKLHHRGKLLTWRIIASKGKVKEMMLIMVQVQSKSSNLTRLDSCKISSQCNANL